MDVLLSLMRIIKEFHATLPDQPKPNPTAPWLEFGEGNGTPRPASELPYSVERDFQCQHPERQARDWYLWKPQGKSCRLGFYPTLCDHWKRSYVDLKFWGAHLQRK